MSYSIMDYPLYDGGWTWTVDRSVFWLSALYLYYVWFSCNSICFNVHNFSTNRSPNCSHWNNNILRLVSKSGLDCGNRTFQERNSWMRRETLVTLVWWCNLRGRQTPGHLTTQTLHIVSQHQQWETYRDCWKYFISSRSVKIRGLHEELICSKIKNIVACS